MDKCYVDKTQARVVIREALSAVNNREGFFDNGISRPEESFMELIKAHGEEISNDAFAINALFLSTTMIFGSSTERHFTNIANIDAFHQYSWLFDPYAVLEHDEDFVIRSLMDYMRPAGYTRRAIYQWMHNCQILVEKYGGDVRNFFLEHNNDALEVSKNLIVYPRAKNKKGFRRYGPKLTALLMQWTRQYNIYEMDNLDKVGIPIDFQLGRIAMQTGMIRTNLGGLDTHTVTNLVLPGLLMELCAKYGWNPREVSEALWNIGSIGCTNKNHEGCPISSQCTLLISRIPYDKGGVFLLEDAGRYGDNTWLPKIGFLRRKLGLAKVYLLEMMNLEGKSTIS